MTPQTWITVGLFVVAAVAQIINGRILDRMKRLEDAVDKINKRRSEEEDKTQVWHGDVDVRLALLEQLNDVTRKREAIKWPRQ